ncbi:MAG: stage V sporulation protein D [Candidatus Aenigmarchaeota archaeon]|nr:stage V sporulation protein D [Candidatus Aenigmarchaeota archaeon]
MASYKETLIQKRRILYLLLGVFLTTILVFIRLFYLQVVRHKDFSALATSQHWTRSTLLAKRGQILVEDYYTHELYPIALNQALDMVFVVPAEIEDREETALRLSEILNIEKEKILEMFELGPYYAPIKHKLTEEETKAIEEAKLKGVMVTSEQWRYYPEGELLSQVLGFVDRDGNGKYGIEEVYNNILVGKSGVFKGEKDPSGIPIVFGENFLEPPKDGDNLVLTINRDIQLIVEQKLKEAVEKHRADGGSVIVMDPNNGAVLAMANYPTFDSNKYEEVNQDSYYVFNNPCVAGEFEPGSVFKIVTMAAGLDSGKIEPEDTFYDTGSKTINGRTITNANEKTYGKVTMTQVLAQSINLGTVHILSEMGKDIFYSYIKKFGLGVKTGIDAPYEAFGKVFEPHEVGDHHYATMTFGQGISITPIQLATVASAIANGGNLVQPHLIKKILKEGKNEEVKEYNLIGQVISPATAANLTKMMIKVVEEGHGYQAKIKGYKIAGKTGTAQVPAVSGYDPNKTIGSFVGFAPALDPKFVILVKIDVPRDVVWAESTAVPVFGEIADFLLKYFQIPPSE